MDQETSGANATADTTTDTTQVASGADEQVDELLIEEISIDGMCGVY